MKKFVQPNSATGYRFTSYRIVSEGEWPLTEIGYIYHKIDLSDLAEPYLSAVKKSLAENLTPKETEEINNKWRGNDGSEYLYRRVEPREERGIKWGEHEIIRTFPHVRWYIQVFNWFEALYWRFK